MIFRHWPNLGERIRMMELRRDLDRFVEGGVITVSAEPYRAGIAYLSRLHDAPDEVWEIRSRHPKPAIRVFGRFAAPDLFIALSWSLLYQTRRPGTHWNGKMQSVTAKPYGVSYSLPTTLTAGHGYASTSQDITFCFTDQGAIPPEVLAYFRASLRDQFHDLVLQEFVSQKALDPDLTQAIIARRVGKRPEQINRWLGSSGNWTVDTLSDLLLAISTSVPRLSVEHLVPPDHSQADMAFTPYAPFAGGTYVIECKGASINVGLPTPGAANITVLFPGGQSHALLAAGE